ncbi:MAG: HAD-IA family hydrolase [Acidobacteria bacterium]|nr:HAD-IA family hydrolase [Acidobacteriota bacterium]
MSPCRAVLFDLDGTLVDAFGAVTEALNAARAACGLPAQPLAVVRRQVGWGLTDLLARNVGPDEIEEARRRFESHYAAHHLERTHLLPGAAAAVRELARRGLRLGVASNKPPAFSREILERLGLAPQFDAILGPGPDLPPKPDPAMLKRACALLGVAPAEALYVGDMPLDVETAARAGMPHLLVPTGAVPADELAGVPGAALARDLLDVVSRVATTGPR